MDRPEAQGVTMANPSDRAGNPTLSPRQLMVMRAVGHRGFIIGAFVTALYVFMAVAAPLIAPFDPLDQNLLAKLAPPVWQDGGSWQHPLGTDSVGRDYLSRLIFGARISIMIGFFAALVSAIVGTSIGLLGGYFGGRVDAVVMYIVNVKLAMPGLLVALALVSAFGSSFVTLVIILSLLFWDRYAIVVRTLSQQFRNQDFVLAARAAGASTARILFRELLPNLMNAVIVVLTLEMALAIVIEAALSFLGLGVRPPNPSWGLMISEGRQYMFFRPHLVIAPGVAILGLVIAINVLGDGFRDIAAPEDRR
ncbi:MAG: peptide ABC transporter permease [Maritimibacter sp.]|nr:peptide ABC transporter permease [Maritimibacter sp.]|tara:strand:- start:6275 stop:7198 length:924 start_codon:yes stop_codon:yes gene_type:complete